MLHTDLCTVKGQAYGSLTAMANPRSAGEWSCAQLNVTFQGWHSVLCSATPVAVQALFEEGLCRAVVNAQPPLHNHEQGNGASLSSVYCGATP